MLGVVVPEGRQGLDHGIEALPGGAAVQPAPGGVAGQGFPQDMDQRGVARQERGACPGECQVEAAQGFTGAGRAGDEHDEVASIRLRGLHRLGYGSRGSCKPALAGLRLQQCIHVVPGIEGAGGFDQGGHRTVRTSLPGA